MSQEEQGFVRRTHVFQLSRLHAEIDALRGDPKPPYHETRASLAVAEKRRNPLGTALPDEDWAYARMTLKVSSVFGGYLMPDLKGQCRRT